MTERQLNLDNYTTRQLDAIAMVHALAAGDQEAAFLTVARYDGQHDQLALAAAHVAVVMLQSSREPAAELEIWRAWLLNQTPE